VSGPRRPLVLVLIALALVVTFVAGTMVASGSPASAPAAPAALTPGQWAAMQTSNWLMTTQVFRGVFLPIVMKKY
jgi:hypothetical protein